MQDINKFPLPKLIINKIIPLLKKNNMVFAYQIIATNENGVVFNIYENKGLNLTEWLNQKVFCLLEITKGEFLYKNDEGKKTENKFQYQWLKRPYEFFDELNTARTELNDNGDNTLNQFDEIAVNFFKNWGVNGINLGIYQAKPVFKSNIGIFLLNEYEFEEEIEYLKLEEEVYLRIDELFIRGISPIPDNSKQKEDLAIKKQIVPPAPKPPEEPKQNKGRFNLFPDKNS